MRDYRLNQPMANPFYFAAAIVAILYFVDRPLVSNPFILLGLFIFASFLYAEHWFREQRKKLDEVQDAVRGVSRSVVEIEKRLG